MSFKSLPPALEPSHLPRFIPVVGDAMEPGLPAGHYAAVLPIDCYSGAGIYVVCFTPGTMEFLRVAGFSLTPLFASRDNHAYGPPQQMSRDEFSRIVLGKVVAVCKVLDHERMEAVGRYGGDRSL